MTELCRALAVTRSGFYAWCGRRECAHARRDRQLKLLMLTSFDASKRRYGSPRVYRDLIKQQDGVSRKRVVRLMRRLRVAELRGDTAERLRGN